MGPDKALVMAEVRARNPRKQPLLNFAKGAVTVELNWFIGSALQLKPQLFRGGAKRVTATRETKKETPANISRSKDPSLFRRTMAPLQESQPESGSISRADIGDPGS